MTKSIKEGNIRIKYDTINNFGFRSIKYQYTKCTKDHKKGFVKMTEYDDNNKIKAIISGKLETLNNRNNIPLKFKILMICSLLKHKIIKSTYCKDNPISLDDLITVDSLVYIKGKDGYPINIHPFTGTIKNHHFKDGIEM